MAIDNIDADLFGRGVRGGFFQPSDAMMHKIRSAMYTILREAYAENMVRRERPQARQRRPDPRTLPFRCLSVVSCQLVLRVP